MCLQVINLRKSSYRTGKLYLFNQILAASDNEINRVLLRVSLIFEVEKMKISEKQFAFAQTLEILEMFCRQKGDGFVSSLTTLV